MRRPLQVHLFVLLIGLVFLAGCGGGGGGAAAPAGTTVTPGVSTGAIRGTILDPQTGQAVAGAIVTLNPVEDTGAAASPAAVRRSLSRLPLAMTLTNDFGVYEFQNVPVGSYSLAVSKDGKYGAQISAVVRQGELTTNLDPVVLTPVVSLVGTFRVVKSALADDGMPQVLVWLLGTSLGSVPAVQDDTDPVYRVYRFRIEGIPAPTGASYQLKYFADGHVAQTVTVAVTPVPESFSFTLAAVSLAVDTSSPETNRPPTVSVAGPSGSVLPGTLVTLTATGSDPDSDPLTYHWTQTAGMPVTLAGGNAAGVTFTPSAEGGYTFLVMALDDRGASSLPASVSVHVAAAADGRPTAVALARLSGGTGQSLLQASLGNAVILSALGSTDPEGATLSWQWAQLSGTTVSFQGGGKGVSLLEQDTFSVTLPGSYRFALVVTDPAGHRSDPAYVTVEVAAPPANHPPQAQAVATPGSGLAPLALTLDGRGSSDPDGGDTIAYSWTQLSGPAVTLTGANAAQATASLNVAGVYFFQLVVRDAAGLASAPAIAGVAVNKPGNLAPGLTAEAQVAGTAVTVVDPGSSVALIATATDNDGPQALTYNWVQLSGPPLTLTNPTGASAGAVLSQVDSYSFRVTVSDGDIDSEAIVTLTVNRRPTAVAGSPQYASLLQTVSLNGSASWDADGDPLTYNWTQVGTLPETVTLSDPTTATPNFTPGEIGVYVFELTVNDGRGDSVPATVRVNVSAPPFAGGGLVGLQQNAPGTSDLISGGVGSLPAGVSYSVKAFADPLLSVVLASGVSSSVDGSFSLDIGDNNPLIRENRVYLAVCGAHTVGTPLVLANDVTAPAEPVIDFAGSDPTINSLNATTVTLVGTTEPGGRVAMRVNNIIGSPTSADGAGKFSVSVDASSEPDGAVLIAIMAKDAYDNATAWIPVMNTIKDLTPPTLTLASPMAGDRVPGLPQVVFNNSESLAQLDFTFSDGASNVSTVSFAGGPLLAAGDHDLVLAGLSPALVDGVSYSLTVSFEDAAGNTNVVGPVAVTADTAPPAGILVSPISNVPPTGIKVDYDLSSTASDPLASAQLIVTRESGDPDPHVPMNAALSAITAGTHTGEPVSLPFALQTGTVYRFEFKFKDLAGNVTSIPFAGVGVVPLPAPGSLTLLSPVAGGSIGANPLLSYTLGEDVSRVDFVFDRIMDNNGGSGPVQLVQSKNATQAQMGLHQDIPAGAAPFLMDGDVYNLTVKLQYLDGSSAIVARAEALVVDALPPQLLSAQALQSVFGVWTPGDRVVFTFSEPMHTGIYGGLTDQTGLNAGLQDDPNNDGIFADARYTDWGPGTLVWSNEDTVLTLTLTDLPGPGLPFVAGNIEDPNIARIRTTGSVRDRQGNAALTPGTVELISDGDVTPPLIGWISPREGLVIPAAPLITWRSSEDLSSLILRVFQVTGTTETPIVGSPFDVTGFIGGTNNLAGKANISVDFSTEGVSLSDGSYVFELEGQDRAGQSRLARLGSLTVDTTAPQAPNPLALSFHNYSGGKVKILSSIGKPGERLRVYINGTPSTAVYAGPYHAGEIPIAAVQNPVAAGDTVQYSLIDEAGNESSLVADGTVPPAFPAGDAAYLAFQASGTYYLQGDGLSLAENSIVAVVFDEDPAQTIVTVTVTGGAVMGGMILDGTLENIIQRAPAFMPAVYYGVMDGNGNVGALAADGVLARLVSAAGFNGGVAGNFDAGDTIAVTFSSPVSFAAAFSGLDFAGGIGGQNSYSWPGGSLNNINMSLWSSSNTAPFNLSFYNSDTSYPGGAAVTHGFLFSSFVVAPDPGAENLQIELNWPGLSTVQSEGGHAVLPSSHITPGGSTGGVTATGF